MVLKIAILAEKYATDLRWYVDTILKLISISGDHVSDPIWHRVVQIVTNHPQGDLQGYAAATLLVAISPRRCHETAIRVAAYILGEFGFLIAERPGMSGEEQFRVLHQHWHNCNGQTRALLITTYAKLANLYEECRPLVAPVLSKSRNSVDVEIQQRSSEYAAMREAFSPEAVEDLLREMPPFEDRRQSALEQRLKEKEGEDSAAVAKAARPSAAQQQRAAQAAAAARAAEEAAAQAEQEGAMNGEGPHVDQGKCFLGVGELFTVMSPFISLSSLTFLFSLDIDKYQKRHRERHTMKKAHQRFLPSVYQKRLSRPCGRPFPTCVLRPRACCSRTRSCRSELSMNMLARRAEYRYSLEISARLLSTTLR